MRRRSTACGVLPDLSAGSVPSMIAVKGTFSRKTAVASRRALPLTATTTSAPGRLVNGWTETSFGSPGATGALGAPRADALPPSTAAKIATHAADMRTLEPITITGSISEGHQRRCGQPIMAAPRIRLHGHQRLQIAAANHAGEMLVIARAGPVRLQAHPTVVAVGCQRRDLAAPVDSAFAHRPPDRLVPLHTSVLPPPVSAARHGQLPVSIGVGNLARDITVCRIPNYLQIRMIDRG